MARFSRFIGSCAAAFLLLSVIGWFLGGARDPVAASPEPGGPARYVSCTYRAQIDHLPPHARRVRVWVPLAKTGREQRIERRDVRAPVPYAIAQDPDYGNDVLFATLEPPIAERLEIAVDYTARLSAPDGEAAEQPPTPEELQRNLEPGGLMIIDDEVRDRARRATAGRAALVSKAKGIYDAVRRTMTYDKTTPGWGRGDTRRACVLGKGNCTDFHSLFVSMARAERIPARFKIGFVVPPESFGVVPGYHCWAEFYEEGRGWVPVDASEAWKHPELAEYYFGARDPRRFLISTGRDIRLVPRQEGEPVNMFFSPYVEVDGRPFSEVNVEVRFTDLQNDGRTK